MVYTLNVSKYYSEKEGLVRLRYDYKLVIENNDGYVEYIDSYGRHCKMKFYKNEQGYLWTSLALDNHKRKSCRINRLVYSNVYGEIPKGYEVDHIDRNKENNLPENLRLATKSENNLNKDIKGEKNPFSKLTAKEVREILVLALEHKMTKQEIADRYNVSFGAVKSIRSGQNWYSVTKDIFERYGISK